MPFLLSFVSFALRSLGNNHRKASSVPYQTKLIARSLENKVKSNVSPWQATVKAITANGGIITSSGSSLEIRIIVIYGKGLELTDACNTTRVG